MILRVFVVKAGHRSTTKTRRRKESRNLVARWLVWRISRERWRLRLTHRQTVTTKSGPVLFQDVCKGSRSGRKWTGFSFQGTESPRFGEERTETRFLLITWPAIQKNAQCAARPSPAGSMTIAPPASCDWAHRFRPECARPRAQKHRVTWTAPILRPRWIQRHCCARGRTWHSATWAGSVSGRRPGSFCMANLERLSGAWARAPSRPPVPSRFSIRQCARSSKRSAATFVWYRGAE